MRHTKSVKFPPQTTASDTPVSALLALSVIELNAVRLTKLPPRREMHDAERHDFDAKERQKRKAQLEAIKSV